MSEGDIRRMDDSNNTIQHNREVIAPWDIITQWIDTEEKKKEKGERLGEEQAA